MDNPIIITKCFDTWINGYFTSITGKITKSIWIKCLSTRFYLSFFIGCINYRNTSNNIYKITVIIATVNLSCIWIILLKNRFLNYLITIYSAKFYFCFFLNSNIENSFLSYKKSIFISNFLNSVCYIFSFIVGFNIKLNI